MKIGLLLSFFLTTWALSSQRALYFDGVDDYAYVDSGVVLTNADWTLEFEFLPEVDFSGTQYLMDLIPSTAGVGFSVYLSYMNLFVKVVKQDPYVSATYDTTYLFHAKRHYYIALTYESSTQTLTLYVNGIKQTGSSAIEFPSEIAGKMYIGINDILTSSYYQGYMDDIHLIQSLKYTADYTPDTATPTTETNTTLLLDCEDNNKLATLVDQSVNALVLNRMGNQRTLEYTTPDMTLGWGRFNGETSLAETAAFAFDTATGFTIEFDIRPEDPSMNSWVATPYIMGQGDNIAEDSDNGFYLYLDYATTPATLKVDFLSSGTKSTFSIAFPPYDEWTRVALIVPAGTSPSPRAYSNGSASYSSAASLPLTHYNSDVFQIGGMYDIPSARMDLDNVRITAGEAYALGDYEAFPLPEDSSNMLAFYGFDSSTDVPSTSTDVGLMSVDEALFGGSVTLESANYNYLRCPSFPFGADNWSFDFFLNLNSTGDTMTVWDSYVSSNFSGVSLYIDSAAQLHVQLGHQDYHYSTYTFSSDQDDYVFLGYEESYDVGPGGGDPHLTLYVNGTRIEDKEVNPYIEATAGLFFVGCEDQSDHPLDGTLDSFRISSITRHSPDLTAFVVPEGVMQIDTPVLAMWEFDEGSGAASYSDSTGNEHTLTPCNVLSFTQQPVDNELCPGETLTLSVVCTDPDAVFHWRKNGLLIPDALSSTLTIPTVNSGDAGSYSCEAGNTCRTLISSSAIVTVHAPIIRNSAFSSDSYCSGEDILLEVDVTCDDALIPMVWDKDGVVISGETGVSLELNNAQPEDSGVYTCTVETEYGCQRAFIGNIQIAPYLLGAETSVTLCDPDGTAVLHAVNICGKPGSILWSGTGIVSGSTTYEPTVQPGSVGRHVYHAVFTPDDGSGNLVRQVILTVIDPGIFGTPELADLWEMAAFWRENGIIDYDFMPAGNPDDVIDIRDLISVTSCPDFVSTRNPSD